MIVQRWELSRYGTLLRNSQTEDAAPDVRRTISRSRSSTFGYTVSCAFRPGADCTAACPHMEVSDDNDHVTLTCGGTPRVINLEP